MKILLTKKEKSYKDLTNDLTREMDTFLTMSNEYFETYLYDKCQNKWPIRYPGATRGHVEVNEDDVIIDIKLYDDKYHTDGIYKPEVRDIFKKYIGMKLSEV